MSAANSSADKISQEKVPKVASCFLRGVSWAGNLSICSANLVIQIIAVENLLCLNFWGLCFVDFLNCCQAKQKFRVLCAIVRLSVILQQNDCVNLRGVDFFHSYEGFKLVRIMSDILLFSILREMVFSIWDLFV